MGYYSRWVSSHACAENANGPQKHSRKSVLVSGLLQLGPWRTGDEEKGAEGKRLANTKIQGETQHFVFVEAHSDV